ncbi:hypothetical protein GCM10027053_04510 [Intrasporangium mesophilum]
MTSNDGPQETPAEARARRRAELPQPGTVQQEAALLVDLLSQRGWAPPAGMPSGRAGESAGDGAQPGHDARGAGASSGSGQRQENGSQRSGPDGQHECTCGGRTPAACAVCPVCQLIAFVQQVNPETIDKVADFVGFAATALRDLATAQRERQSDAGRNGTDSEAGPTHEADDPHQPHGEAPS